MHHLVVEPGEGLTGFELGRPPAHPPAQQIPPPLGGPPGLAFGRREHLVQGDLAQDRQAAAVMGIPTERMSALGWAIGLGCVGVAGTMLSTFFYIFPDVGVSFALLAFVAVALGGFGSILGSLVAGLLIGLVESLGGLLLDPSYKTLIVFALYLGVVIVRPTGLFGRF